MSFCRLCGAGFEFVGDHRPECQALKPLEGTTPMMLAKSVDELLKMLKDDHPLHIELTKKLERLSALETIHPFTSRMMREHDYELMPPGSKEAIRVAATLLKDIKIDADNAVEAGWISPMTEHTEGQLQAWLELPVVKSAQQ